MSPAIKKFAAVIMTAGALGFTASADEQSSNNEPTWLAPTLGPITPHIHFNGAVGDSSGDVAELATAHHDPSREDGAVQGLELGTSLRLNRLEGFATYVFIYGADEEWEDEWEEAFLKLRDLPGGFEVRGGRLLNRFGQQNAKHLHSWSFVDMPLPLSRFTGEHGLWTEGGDATWLKQDILQTYGITLGYGDAIESHQHEEHAAEEEEHHAEDVHDHEAHEDEHEHHDVAFDDGIFSSRAFVRFHRNDFHNHEVGFSTATGEEEEGREMMVFSLDYVYTWREKGLEAGGQAFNWTTELMYRELEHGKNRLDDEGDVMPVGGEFGFYSQGVWSFADDFDASARVDYVEGNEELGTEQHYRLSPALTYYPDPYRRTSIRAQYNYDDVEHHDDEHTVWLQVGLSWGGAEVR